MNYLIILRQPVSAIDTYEVELNFLQRLAVLAKEESDAKVQAIFFTDRAVTISSDDVAVIPQHKAIQEKLIELKDKLQCELLVCGRAFKNAAISSEKLNSNFTLSGNFELSSMIATADRVIEF